MSAIVLVSGGMDSCVSAAIAAAENERLAFLHISYGQRTVDRERKAFNDIADFYGVKDRLDVSIEYLAKIGGSSLTDASMTVTEADLESKEIPTSYVPFRNANMLAIATSWAEVIAAVTAGDIQRLAAECFQTDRVAFVALGDIGGLAVTRDRLTI